MEVATMSRPRPRAGLAMAAVVLAAFLSAVAIALGSEDSPDTDRRAGSGAEVDAPSARPGKAGPAHLPLTLEK